MRIVTGIFLLILVAGCSNKDKIPAGILPREEMGNVLWDMVQADQYADGYLIKDSALTDRKTETLKLYEMVLRLHKVSRDQFSRSFQFYKGRPDLTRPLFDSLLAKGNRLRTETYARMSTPPATKPAAGIAPIGRGKGPAVVLPNGRPLRGRNGLPPAVRDTAGARMKGNMKGNMKGSMKGRSLLGPGMGHRNPVTAPPGTRGQ